MKERSGGRSAACATCGKTFARSDTLLRHEKSHHATEDRGPIHRVTDGTFRACSACAAARSRCSGGSPCGRCNMRKIECSYPNKRRKGPAETYVLKFDSQSPKQHSMQQFQDVVFSSSNQVRFADSNGPSPPKSSNPGQSPHSGRHASLLHPFSDQSSYRETFRSEPLDAGQSEAARPPAAFSHMQPATNQVHQNQQYGDPSLQAQYPPDFGTVSYDYPTFEDSMNWIPVSVYPSPYDNEFEHDISFLLPPLPDSSPMGLDYSTGAPVQSSSQLYKMPEPVTQGPSQGSDNHGFPVSFIGIDQSPASSASNEHLASKSTTSSTGTGDAKRKRRKSSFVPDLFTKPRNEKVGFAFPNFSSPESAVISSNSRHYCSEGNYDIIVNAFRKLCVETVLSRSFENSNFPDFDSLNACVDLYFENFHSNFPLLHRPTFETNTHWVVVLATAAIGSTFVEDAFTLDLREAFQEFLRRAIHQSADGATDYDLDLSLAHARILNLIGLTQSDREQLRSLAPRYHADLSRWCLESGVLQLSGRGDVDAAGTPYANDAWREWERWIRVESLRRVGYFSWLLDTSLAYLANCRPLCNMDDARTPLPCSEILWNAPDPAHWKSKYGESATSPSLCAALEHLYAKKAINPQLSDISQILLVNALFQRTWEVGTHIKQPLSEWVPTGKARGFLNTPTKDSFWLPLYPLYANWRNSACDCLDVIHWQAASIVAKASGVEHDLMLHLHLARIILLTPFQEIQDLLFSLIGRVGDSSRASFYVHDGSYQPRNLAKLPQIRKITWRWLREDQHKARLAMVHAGSVFWHVRRYSSTSFYEPVAVYLASLVLWTYGSYKSAALERDAAANSTSKPVGGPSGPDSDLSIVQPSRVEQRVGRSSNHARPSHSFKESHPPPNRPPHTSPTQPSPPSDAASPTAATSNSDSESSSSNQLPQFIHLDRPCDDEMVQHFVRNGHNMSGHMANVGDICKTPNKVLVEGAKLLRTRLSCWGVSREYYEVLVRLEEVVGKKG